MGVEEVPGEVGGELEEEVWGVVERWKIFWPNTARGRVKGGTSRIQEGFSLWLKLKQKNIDIEDMKIKKYILFCNFSHSMYPVQVVQF